MSLPLRATITLPDWVSEVASGVTASNQDERMSFAVMLAERNIRDGGGPFGAAIFDTDSDEVVAVGVNVVVSESMAIAHAEVVAIALACTAVSDFDLATIGRTELVTSTEPCTMCLGAVLWSGVHSLVCGARDEDARAVGFDEGPKPSDWANYLQEAGIAVTMDVQRDAASAVLQKYAAEGGVIY